MPTSSDEGFAQSRADAIAEAAFELFAQHGYADTKMDAVAKRAGVAKGTLYLYFASKEELFRGVIERKIAPIIAALAKGRAETSASTGELLGGLYARVADLIRSGAPNVFRMVIGESARFPELATIYFDQIIEPGLAELSALLARGVERGDIRSAPVVHHPEALMAPAVLAMLWQVLFSARHPIDPEALLEAHAELVMRGLRPAEDSS